MHGGKLFSFLDTALLMAPIAALMLLTLLRMDERVAKAHIRGRRRNRFCEVGPGGRGVLFDPDGKRGGRLGFPQPSGGSRLKFVRSAASDSGARREIQWRGDDIPFK
jgi:hypothetical protein